MDGNNWRAAQGQVPMPGQVIGNEAVAPVGMEGGGDWRTHLQPDSRQRIVNKIMETLKRHLPFSGQEGLQELKKIAVRFEEEIYTAATSQSDYLRKISLKMLTMETKSQNPMAANPIQSNTATNSKNLQDPASLDSLLQTGKANGGDWQEEIYQKIKSMNETFSPELNEMYQRMAAKLQQHDSLPQQPKNEQLEKLRFFKVLLERLILFLQTNKNDIQPSHKDKISGVHKQIVNILSSNRPRKPVSAVQQGQLTQPHLHALQQSGQQQPQIYQMHMKESQMNSQVQPMNVQGPVLSGHQNNLCMNMMDDLPTRSNIDPGQGNALNKMQQVAINSLQQNPVSGPQQKNSNLMSSGNGLTTLPNANPLQENSNILQPHQIDQQDLLISHNKGGTPFQSANSPFIVPSPSTLTAPSPMPSGEKINSGVSTLSNTGNMTHHSTTSSSIPNQSLAIGTTGISASPLLAEFTSHDGTYVTASTIPSGSTNVVEQPLQRLMRVVKSDYLIPGEAQLMLDVSGEFVECYCGIKAHRLTSRMSKHPGREFFTCRLPKPAGCDFFCWADQSESSNSGRSEIKELEMKLLKRNGQIKSLLVETDELKKQETHLKVIICIILGIVFMICCVFLWVLFN